MLAAIVPNQDTAWFFKLTGDPDIVLRNLGPFREIIDSVEFPATGDPRWRLSEGWAEQRFSGGMTYASLTQPDDGLTATVTQLPLTADSSEEAWHSYVALNVNRWRKQLALEEQSWDEMRSELEEVPALSQGATKAYFVSLAGAGSGSMTMAPFMSQAAGGNQSSGSNTTSNSEDKIQPTSAASNNGLTYVAPPQWQELEASGMRRAAFAIKDGEAEAELTVIAAGGNIEANIGIWLGQVSADATAENKQAVLASAEPVKVNEVEAQMYAMEGQAVQGGEVAAILIVDIPWQTGESLFVKLKGDKDLVAAQRSAFVEFVESIQW
jgi:hypothetical protein